MLSGQDDTVSKSELPLGAAMIVPSLSEEEKQGIRVNGKHLALLPRSVRWRLQLGILHDPTANSSGDVKEQQECKLENVAEYNSRQLKDQKERFSLLIDKYVNVTFDDLKNEGEESNNQISLNTAEGEPRVLGANSDDIDPLTAMVIEKEAQETRKAELYLKYRKEKAMRKRGLVTEAKVVESETDGVDRASLIIIEKDLKRLPHPTEGKQSLMGSPSPPSMTPELEARMTSLQEILYIYAQEHPEMGYRQGMHEVASYLLYLLELESKVYPDHPLFNPILPICFILLERTLDHLKTAYEASGGKSLQQMSIAILGKILQNDPALYYHLTNNPNIPPPPIYCTRWVRLMFSREVVGYENVFKLWDVFFSYANVMQALEMASASRILLMSSPLMHPESNTLDLLMNVPPLTDIGPLTITLEKLMKQKENDQAIDFPSLQIASKETAALPHHLISNSDAATFRHTIHTERSPQLPQHHHKPPSQGTDSLFSFQSMRQSLNQKSETLRKKIITTTVEWKEAASKRDSGISFDPLLGVAAVMQSNKAMEVGNRGDGQRSVQASQSYGDFTYHDSSVPQTNAIVPGMLSNGHLSRPITPKQHQHEMWSKLLQQKIWTVQQFLLDLESKENRGYVPRNVWEALADMDKMQRELLNYSRSDMCGGVS